MHQSQTPSWCKRPTIIMHQSQTPSWCKRPTVTAHQSQTPSWCKRPTISTHQSQTPSWCKRPTITMHQSQTPSWCKRLAITGPDYLNTARATTRLPLVGNRVAEWRHTSQDATSSIGIQTLFNLSYLAECVTWTQCQSTSRLRRARRRAWTVGGCLFAEVYSNRCRKRRRAVWSRPRRRFRCPVCVTTQRLRTNVTRRWPRQRLRKNVIRQTRQRSRKNVIRQMRQRLRKKRNKQIEKSLKGNRRFIGLAITWKLTIIMTQHKFI